MVPFPIQIAQIVLHDIHHVLRDHRSMILLDFRDMIQDIMRRRVIEFIELNDITMI